LRLEEKLGCGVEEQNTVGSFFGRDEQHFHPDLSSPSEIKSKQSNGGILGFL
jgi:hypothetical protein